MRPQGLPPEYRVRKRRDFERAYEEGHKVVTPEFAIFARPNGTRDSRIGVTATRRIGPAVQRNRARRLVREAFRRNRAELPEGFDLVVVVRRSILRSRSSELGRGLVRAAAAAAALAGEASE